jgi:hypothetical protein
VPLLELSAARRPVLWLRLAAWCYDVVVVVVGDVVYVVGGVVVVVDVAVDVAGGVCLYADCGIVIDVVICIVADVVVVGVCCWWCGPGCQS